MRAVCPIPPKPDPARHLLKDDVERRLGPTNMIEGVTNSDALPVLERLLQFAGRRHRVIVNNIANLSTPNFRPQDLSVDRFQAALGGAIDHRREHHGNAGGPLESSPGGVGAFDALDSLLSPQASGRNILFHDRNDRSVESIMQDLVENYSVFRLAAEFTRSRFDLINSAIRERV